MSLWYPLCPAQAAGLCDRLWIVTLCLSSEVWKPKRNLGIALQRLVWKSRVTGCCTVCYVRDGCCLSGCCFVVLLYNIFIIVSITYLLNVTFVKRYFGKPLMNRNYFHEKFKSTLKSENAYCNSVQKLLSSSLLSKNTKIKIDRATILPIVLRGRWTCAPTLCQEYRVV